MSASKRSFDGISVTEIRNAMRCPRIFVLGRMLSTPVAFPVGGSSLGATFHRIADLFARGIHAPPPWVAGVAASSPVAEIEDALRRWLLDDYLVAELEASPVLASMPSEVDDLAEALRQWCTWLARDWSPLQGNLAQALQSRVVQSELPVEGFVDLEGGLGFRVTGRVDALYRTGAGAIEVVEYKLTDEANDELDRAQVALYRHLLRSGLQLQAAPVVLRFNPSLTAIRLPPEQADALIQERLLPLVRKMAAWAKTPDDAPPPVRSDLCATCPVRDACLHRFGNRLPQRDNPPANAARPRPDPQGKIELRPANQPEAEAVQDDAGKKEAAELSKRLVAELKSQGVNVTAAPPIVGARLIAIEILGHNRQRVGPLDAAAEDMRFRLSDWGLDYQREGGRRSFVASRKTTRDVPLAALLSMRKTWLASRPGRFVVGEGLDGEPVVGDLSDGSTPHLLIGGQAGSGKSVLLRALVISLAQYQPPSSIRFSLVDPKRVTFTKLRSQLAEHLDGPVIYDPEPVLKRLEDLAQEMEERYRSFEERDVEDINGYNEVASERERLPRHVLVIDEFQDLTLDKSTQKPFLEGIARLGAKARAAGIHLILATQRPDQKVVPGIIKANLGGKIALKVASAVNSRIVLDQAGAESLLGKGDLLVDLGHGLVRAQAAMA